MTTLIDVPAVKAEITRLTSLLEEARQEGSDIDAKWTALQARTASLTIHERKEQDRLYAASKAQDVAIAGLERKISGMMSELAKADEQKKERDAYWETEFAAIRNETAVKARYYSSQKLVRIAIVITSALGIFLIGNAYANEANVDNSQHHIIAFSLIILSGTCLLWCVDSFTRLVLMLRSGFLSESLRKRYLVKVDDSITLVAFTAWITIMTYVLMLAHWQKLAAANRAFPAMKDAAMDWFELGEAYAWYRGEIYPQYGWMLIEGLLSAAVLYVLTLYVRTWLGCSASKEQAKS